MTRKEVLEALKAAIASDALVAEDRYGFKRLDILVGQLRSFGGSIDSVAVASLIDLLPDLADAGPEKWKALRNIISELALKSTALANAIDKILDHKLTPSDPWARYWAYAAFQSAGGTLRMNKLLDEAEVRQSLAPLWLDLATDALRGAPDAIIMYYEEALRSTNKLLSWEDARRRIPKLIEVLGNEHFVSGIKRISAAISSPSDRLEFCKSVDSYNPIGLAKWTEAAGSSPSRLQTEPRYVSFSGDAAVSTAAASYTRIGEMRRELAEA